MGLLFYFSKLLACSRHNTWAARLEENGHKKKKYKIWDGKH